jgi:NAD(P)-dependent dehydrogenase (short-subunit alcohol dehydrogenase family)
MPTYLITGARQGIGLGLVKHLASDSNHLILALVRDLKGNLTQLEKARSKGRAKVFILECDIASSQSIHHLPALIGVMAGPDVRLDYVLNIANVQRGEENALHMTSETLLGHVAVNVLGPAHMLQVLLPFLAEKAVICNCTSIAGSLEMVADGRVGAENAAYNISKAALNMLTVMQARELRKTAIVVAMEPGNVQSELGNGADAFADVQLSDSVEGMLSVLHGLKKKDSGKFFKYTGDQVEW